MAAFDAERFGCRVAAEVKAFVPEAFMDVREARTLPRVVQFGIAATRLALDDAQLRTWTDPTRVGILMGTSSGSLAYAFEQHAVFLERGARRMHPSAPAFAHNSVIASECAIQFGARGPVLVVSSACTSSTDAIGLGAGMIESGLADVVLVGGAEAPITPSLFAAFDRLGMMPRNFNDVPECAARPFDRQREGLVLGEGAVTFVLEDEAEALARGVNPLAVVRGYGATCDAHSHFHQKASGEDAIRAISMSVKMAGVGTGAIDFVSAHGTGTRENDPFEAGVLRRVLGSAADSVPVGAVKSQCGHLLGASGALSLASVVEGMSQGFIPGTINLEDPDEECRLAHVRKTRSGRIDLALCTSFGFGARNAALVVGRYERADEERK